MPSFANPAYDTAHLLDTAVLMLSFALLYQRRLFAVLTIYAWQALFLAAAAAWQANAQAAPHLYITAGIALIFKAIVIPLALHRRFTAPSRRRSASAPPWRWAWRWWRSRSCWCCP
jgi:hydrogenase-4 component E